MGMRRTALLLASTALVVLLTSGVALATGASQTGTTAAPGTTIVVNSKGDGAKTGNCTLREAIGAANANARVDGCKAGSTTQRDAIHFSIGEEATIVLGSELPLITDASGLTINGQQKAEITVSGNDTVRVLHVGEGAKLAIANLTVSHGRASSDGGGGIRSSYGSTLKVTNATFSGNSAYSYGGGIFNEGMATAILRNTILDNGSGTNPGTTSGGNCYGIGAPGSDGGYNIEDGTSCYFSEANNSMPSTEPLLADSLANNGGPTKTIALLKGSPAINATPEATNGCGTEITKDQRGVTRPQGEGCDVGAFERVVRR